MNSTLRTPGDDLIHGLAHGSEGILIPWALIEAVEGDYLAAAVLRRITWWYSTWAGVDRDGQHWIAITRAQLGVDLRVSEDQVWRAVNRLVERGLLLKGGQWLFHGARTMHYRPDPDHLREAVRDSAQTGARFRADRCAIPRRPVRDSAHPYTEESPEEATRSSTPLGAYAPPPPNPSAQSESNNSSDEGPTSEPCDSRAFEEFWAAYPPRNGKKLGRGDAFKQWTRLRAEDHGAVMTGVRHYAAACDAGQLAKDAFRWLRDRCWEDWQTPAVPTIARFRSNGHAPSTLDAVRAVAEREGLW